MKEDELNLWKRCRQGDEAACEELVLSYLYLVKFWVRIISRVATWANREDLMQEGTIGLIKAVSKFDPGLGYKFTTHARYYIREAIFKSPELTRNVTRRPGEDYRKIKRLHDELMQKLERRPTVEEIAEEAGLTVEQVENALDAMSLAFPGEFTYAHESAQVDTDVIKRQDSIILIQDALSGLSEKERAILTRYYWGEQTSLEIAKQLGLTEASVNKIRQRALIRLKSICGLE